MRARKPWGPAGVTRAVAIRGRDPCAAKGLAAVGVFATNIRVLPDVRRTAAAGSVLSRGAVVPLAAPRVGPVGRGEHLPFRCVSKPGSDPKAQGVGGKSQASLLAINCSFYPGW